MYGHNEIQKITMKPRRESDHRNGTILNEKITQKKVYIEGIHSLPILHLLSAARVSTEKCWFGAVSYSC